MSGVLEKIAFCGMIPLRPKLQLTYIIMQIFPQHKAGKTFIPPDSALLHRFPEFWPEPELPQSELPEIEILLNNTSNILTNPFSSGFLPVRRLVSVFDSEAHN